jgi:hypothetical protein
MRKEILERKYWIPNNMNDKLIDSFNTTIQEKYGTFFRITLLWTKATLVYPYQDLKYELPK